MISSMAVLLALLLLLMVEFGKPEIHNDPDAEGTVVIATIGQSVNLPCNYTLHTPLDPLRVRIYWQGKKSKQQNDYEQVLHVFNKGREEPERQDEQFRDRTSIQLQLIPLGLLSLRIAPVTPQDDSTHIITYLQMPDNSVRSICKTTLRAVARFQKPEVSVVCLKTEGEVLLVCTSDGGFPKPTVSWTGVNFSTPPDTNVTLNSKNSSYSINSILRLNGTQHPRGTCTVTNPALPETLSTSVRLSEHCVGATPESGTPTKMVIMCVVVVLPALTCVLLFLLKETELCHSHSHSTRCHTEDPIPALHQDEETTLQGAQSQASDNT
ncbi:hypothetical protein JZ751_020272 [Albula glossodonta]|uniref:Ig-like domain-containing protein n=1 Tax=Albula glossodonta TaxID=121402 RepID=A0A8T2MSL6_9TELE|nr:hypothetical protein JZ751_020272 [Albula glossodonta]